MCSGSWTGLSDNQCLSTYFFLERWCLYYVNVWGIHCRCSNFCNNTSIALNAWVLTTIYGYPKRCNAINHQLLVVLYIVIRIAIPILYIVVCMEATHAVNAVLEHPYTGQFWLPQTKFYFTFITDGYDILGMVWQITLKSRAYSYDSLFSRQNRKLDLR